MKNIAFSFSFHNTSYLVEVTKTEAISPIYFTAHIFDDELRAKYGKLSFMQKNHESPIEPTLSTTMDEADLKEVILQKIMNKMRVFELP